MSRTRDFSQAIIDSVLTANSGLVSLGPIDFSTSTISTNLGVMSFDGTCFYGTPAGLTGVIPTEQMAVTSSAYTLTSQTAAQKLLNVSTNGAANIIAAGTYQFECSFGLTFPTASTFGFALAGTATISSIEWSALSNIAAGLATGTTTMGTYNTTSSNTTLVPGSTALTGHTFIRGIIRFSGIGTVIPQVSLTVASAAVVSSGAYFKMSPIGNSSVTTVGAWT